MSEKLLQYTNKDNKSKNVIVMSDPVVLEWKVRLMEQFFEKSTRTDIKSYQDETPKAKTTGKDVVSSILKDLLEKVDSSIDQTKEINVSTIEQTFNLSEVGKKLISDVETKTKSMEIVEVTKFNEYNYWKIEFNSKQVIEDEINKKTKDLAHKSKNAVRDTKINDEIPEYNDNNWWKPNDYFQNIKLEIENYEQEVEIQSSTDHFSFVKKPQSKQEGIKCIKSDDISKFNEFNFWKSDISTIDVEAVKYTTVQENFSENLSVKQDDQLILNPMHKAQCSGQNKHVHQLKLKPKQRSQSSDQIHKSQSSNGVNEQQNAKQSQKFPSSDIRIKSSAGSKKPVNAVVMVYNLNPCFMDCDKLYNLISPIAKVRSIKFLKQTEFRTAMVELCDQEGAGAKRVLSLLKGITIFGKVITIATSSKNKVTEFNPITSPSLANGAKSFKDFSQDIHKFTLHHPTSMKYPPTRTLYFHKTPKMTEEEFFELFEKLKAPRPYKVMWFPNKTNMGCLQFKTKREALEAICIANLAMTSTPEKRVHLAFTYAREDYQFYCGKKSK